MLRLIAFLLLFGHLLLAGYNRGLGKSGVELAGHLIAVASLVGCPVDPMGRGAMRAVLIASSALLVWLYAREWVGHRPSRWVLYRLSGWCWHRAAATATHARSLRWSQWAVDLQELADPGSWIEDADDDRAWRVRP